MGYKSAKSRVIDTIKVKKKLLSVMYDFDIQDHTHKWASQRDWRRIENAVWVYVCAEKHEVGRNRETIQVDGDIQLVMSNRKCPGYISKLFHGDGRSQTSSRSPNLYHETQICVVVKFGALKKSHEAAKAEEAAKDVEEVKEESPVDPLAPAGEITNESPFTVSSEDGTPTQATQKKSRRPATPWKPSTSTPFPAEAPEIPDSTTKRKRQDEATQDLIFSSASDTEEPQQPPPKAGKSLRSRREVNILSQEVSPDPKEGPSGACAKKSKLADIVDSDTDPEDTPPVKKTAPKTPVSLTGWLVRSDEQQKLLALKKRKEDVNLLANSPPRKARKRKPRARKEAPPRSPDSFEGGATPAGRLTCHHLSLDELTATFKDVEDRMVELVENYKEYERTPDIRDFHYARYTDMINKKQVQHAMNFLEERFKENLTVKARDYSRMSRFVMQYILPEWIMSVFMAEHQMTRQEAIRYILEQEEKENREMGSPMSV